MGRVKVTNVYLFVQDRIHVEKELAICGFIDYDSYVFTSDFSQFYYLYQCRE